MTDKAVKDAVIKFEKDINDFLLDTEWFETKRMERDFLAILASTRDLRKDIKRFRETFK